MKNDVCEKLCFSVGCSSSGIILTLLLIKKAVKYLMMGVQCTCLVCFQVLSCPVIVEDSSVAT